jgi:hypothetical protein
VANKKDVLERLHFVTDRLSTQVRTLGLGILAVTWGVFIGDSPTAKDMSHGLKVPLLLAGAGSILAMLLDFLQYVAGYLDAQTTLRTLEHSDKEDVKFDPHRLTYRLQSVLFTTKQWSLTIATIMLLGAIAYYLMYHH